MSEYSREKYDALASTYDVRWSSYLSKSLAATLERFPPHQGDTIVDVGCGTGLLLERLTTSSARSLIGLDTSREMLSMSRRRLPSRVALLRAAAARIPCDSGSIDIVVSTSALHYVSDPLGALIEWRRTLRPGGSVVITDWCRDYLTIKLLDRRERGRAGYVRAYSSEELQALLESAGFTEIAVDRYRISWFWGLMTARARSR